MPSNTLGDILDQYRERLGGEISLEEIFLLHDAAEGAATLSEDERATLLDRLAADPDAARRMKTLLRFLEESAEAEEVGAQERWATFRALLPPADERHRERNPAPKNRPSHLGWQQVLGLAATFLLCIALAFWAGRSGLIGGSPGDDSGLQLNTFVVELSTTGQRNRGEKQVTWPVAAEGVLISLSAPEIESTGELELVVLDDTGRAVAARSGLRPDDAQVFFATFSRELLPPGSYEIQLRNKAQEVLSSFDLTIYNAP